MTLARPWRDLAVVGRCVVRPHLAPVSIACLVGGIAYSFSSIDFIPDRLAYVGHLDEVGIAILGLGASYLFAPPECGGSVRLAGSRQRALQRAWFAVRVLRADLANFFMLQYRGVDGFLITAKNSGTHWLKFMLSCAMARQYGVAAPAHASGRAADAIVGHPRWPRPAGVPRIGSSHTIPSVAFAWRWRLFDHPPVVVLVRHPREAMLSSYLKWNHQHNESLDAYIAGDPLGRRHVSDVWWYIHFFNRWGDVARARPANTLIVRYEDLQAAPALWLPKVARHLGMALDDDAVRAGLAFAERDAMADRLDPAFGETIIPDRAERQAVAFTPAHEAAFRAILSRHLRHALGYDLPTRVKPRRMVRAAAVGVER